MRKEYVLVLILILCLTYGAFAETKEAETKRWQIYLEQFTDSIPQTKNLASPLKRVVSTSNSQSATIKYNFFDKSNQTLAPFFKVFSDMFLQIDYGQSALGLNFEMTDSSSTKYNLSGSSSFAGFGAEIGINIPPPWHLSISSLIKYGNIPKTDLTYSSYANGGTNFAQKIRGSWDSSDAIIQISYVTAPIQYLFGLEAITQNFNLIYSDYPLSPAGTEGSDKGYNSNSNVFVGFRSSFMNDGLMEFKYLPPLNPDWLQGFNVKAGWEF